MVVPGQTALREVSEELVCGPVGMVAHRSRLAPSTIMGPAIPNVALFAQPVVRRLGRSTYIDPGRVPGLGTMGTCLPVSSGTVFVCTV